MSARRRELPERLAERPFTLAFARAAGVDSSVLRSVSVQRIGPQVYRAAGDVTLRERVAAQLATMPDDLLVDGLTALQLRGIELGSPEPLRFCSPMQRDIRRAGVRVRRLTSAPTAEDRILTPAAAFAGAAVDLDLVELVVAGDWLVRKRLVSPSALREHVADLSGRHCRKVRRAAEFVRERVDSPPESRLRLCLVLAGLPEPECNLDIGNERFFIARPDLVYLLFRLALEYEGDHHRTDRDQWNRDIERTKMLKKEGYEVLRVTAATMRRPRALVAEVHDLLVNAGYRGPAPTYGPEWIAHFERRFSTGDSGRLQRR
ncbi:MAG: endonuclease domain-containing protein [Microlunatus sp.]|nr:endonuclease domain-containing protein [Microlunatus sp.]